MANEELERLKSDYEKIKRDCDALKDYKRKVMAAEKALKESRGFTSVEFKENCLKEKEINDKAYKDLLEECLSKYNVQTPFAIAYKMKELEDSIWGLEAREQERTQVHEGAKTQQAPSQAEFTKAGLEKEFERQLRQSYQEVSQPQVEGQRQQVSSHDG